MKKKIWIYFFLVNVIMLFTITGCDNETEPNAPSNLVAVVISGSQVNLTWTDNSDNETGFKIEGSADGNTWTEITSVVSNVTSYQNTGLTVPTLFYYRISAYNSVGNSTYATAEITSANGLLFLHDPVLVLQFDDNAYNHNVHIASDGNFLYTCNGGDVTKGKINKYSLTGTFVATYPIAIDMRSIMYNKADGSLYVNGFEEPMSSPSYGRNIYKITDLSSGKFVKTHQNLYDNAQSNLAMSTDGKCLYAFYSGTLKKYNMSNGALLQTLNNLNFGTAGIGAVAVDPDYIYTWNGTNKTVYIYDMSGNLFKSITLTDGSFGLSLSFVDGILFVSNDGNYAVGKWYGFNIRNKVTKSLSIIKTSVAPTSRIADSIDTLNK